MKKNKLIALFAGLSLAFVSSAALAAPSADTLLVAGYDSDQMAVLYGVSDIDQDGDEATLDCTLVGTFVYELETEKDTDTATDVGEEATGVAVTGLEKDGKEAEFFKEGKEDPAEAEALEEGDGVLYSETEDGECQLTSVTIEPNGGGEINHGTIVSTFSNLLQGGNGCMIRHFAQSDFGKGDYEIAEGETVDEVLEVTLQSFETACNKKVKSDSVDDDDDSESRGKSNAPGQEKDRSDKGGKDKAPGQTKKQTQDDDSSSD